MQAITPRPSLSAVPVPNRSSGPSIADPVDSVTPLRPFNPPDLPAVPPSAGRGLALVCVDGLSYPALRYAMGAGRMPHLQKLLEQDGYVAQQFFPGLPCTTPASMTGFTVGANPIPAFRWYDKATGQFYSADSLTTFDQGFEAPSRALGQPGLLSRGTMHSCLVSGGAPGATLTVDMTSRRYQQGGTKAAIRYLAGDYARFAAHHPLRFGQALGEMASDARRDFRDGHGQPLKARLFNAVKESVETGLMGNAGTAEVVDDMHRGVPVTFIDLPANDATGHEYGPFSAEAMEALQRVDANIGRIVDAAHAAGHRQYEVAFLSDHGQTNGQSFQSRYGEALHEVVLKLTRGEPVVEGMSGSLDNLYFSQQPGQMQLADVQARYPDLVDRLVAHPGVGLVVGRQNGSTVILGKGGRIDVDHGEVKRSGADILAAYDSPEDAVIQQLNRLAQLPNAGDLVVFGAYPGGPSAENQTVVTFEDQRGAHGGLGGAQNQAILITEPGRHVSTQDITNPSQMYWVLRSMLPTDGTPA